MVFRFLLGHAREVETMGIEGGCREEEEEEEEGWREEDLVVVVEREGVERGWEEEEGVGRFLRDWERRFRVVVWAEEEEEERVARAGGGGEREAGGRKREREEGEGEVKRREGVTAPAVNSEGERGETEGSPEEVVAAVVAVEEELREEREAAKGLGSEGQKKSELGSRRGEGGVGIRRLTFWVRVFV